MSTEYGKNLKISIYGGSHQDHIGIYAKNLPKGFEFSLDALLEFLSRRAPGRNEFSTLRKESDLPEFLSGVNINGNTFTLNGDELHAIIKNTSQRSADYKQENFIPRPSHADFTARMKYGENVDLRGGGHFSGRLTAPLCIVGGICLQYLHSRGIEIKAHIYSVGSVYDTPFNLANITEEDFAILNKRKEFPTLSLESAKMMKEEINSARLDGDSIGGIIEVGAIGLPIGLGEHIFDGVENRISSIVFGIPAVKGIEFGNGFECATLRGSQNNDPFEIVDEKIRTVTNNCGGILGGMTNGMPLVFRAAMKPTPSIFKEQQSVDMVNMTPATLTIKGRHDPCIVLRAVPVFEAATAIAICDMLLDN
ncbi:MAG: chorismate synthase [Ruminococcaceae bacterium]|nr:chorismate synthase [Oscillospiraceae bacterium]